MSNVFDDFFPSRFLKAADLMGRTHECTITGLSRDNVGTETAPKFKLVLTLHGAAKPLVCNRTNATAIAKALGTDHNKWIGGQVELFSMPVQGPQGMVDGIRLRVLTPQAPAPAPAAPAPAGAPFNDTIPF